MNSPGQRFNPITGQWEQASDMANWFLWANPQAGGQGPFGNGQTSVYGGAPAGSPAAALNMPVGGQGIAPGITSTLSGPGVGTMPGVPGSGFGNYGMTSGSNNYGENSQPGAGIYSSPGGFWNQQPYGDPYGYG
jgi:hypothetical protein